MLIINKSTIIFSSCIKICFTLNIIMFTIYLAA